MPSQNLECLCDKFEEYVPLTIPTTDLQVDALIDSISTSMQSCCVSFTTYNQTTNPVVLTLVSPASNCTTAQALVTVFTSSGLIEGVWDLVECSIKFGTITIETGEDDISRSIQVNCELPCPEPCCEDSCCKQSCCSRDRCSGYGCEKKCCTFYKQYGGNCCGEYSSDEEDFNTCCDNTSAGCRPECEYPDVCFPKPKLDMKYGDYCPDEYTCEEESVGVAKLKTLPFKLPFKARQHRGIKWYLIPLENVDALPPQIKIHAIPTNKGYYKISVNSIQEYTGITQTDAVFKFLDVSGMSYTVKAGSGSEFTLKLKNGQETKFKKIANTVEIVGSYKIYKGFLEDLLRCE